MMKPKYTAGLQFIVTTPQHTPDKHDRKAVRSHATKAVVAGRETVQLRSWISPDRKLEALKKSVFREELGLESTVSVPSPTRIGAAFSGVNLPPGVEPYMIQDLLKLIDLNNSGVYPYEICFDVHPVERGWFPYMISDICCLHSMMFSVRAYLENAVDNHLSRLASFHYAQTLHILQARLHEFNKTSAISDSTIMVVITLASAAELTGDFGTVANHIRGLEKIVSLRGGVSALNTHNNMQVKVCRADLAYALQSGHRPRLFKEVPWDCYVANRGLIQCSHQPHETPVRSFLENMVDTKLYNAWRDLHAFSCISNLAYQTTRNLSPDTYNEMMISILYRLTNISFEDDPLQEAIRTTLLAFSSTIYMQRQFMRLPYDHLLSLCSNALLRLRKFPDMNLPTPLALWLTMLSHVIAYKAPSPRDWQSIWLDETLRRAQIASWQQAREMLRSIAWVDFIHDEVGVPAFKAAMLRLERAV